MSEAPQQFVPGSIAPLAQSSKKRWELGQVRQICAGELTDGGQLTVASKDSSSWQLSLRSIEMAGSFPSAGISQVLTLVSGDFLQLDIDGQAQGLEPLRPLKIEATNPVSTSQPAQELLVLHLITQPDRVRGTVRIIELSKKREQHLFDGQLGVMLQGNGVLKLQGEEQKLNLRDTVIGGDTAEPTISGRGFMAVVSLDLP
ncbi:HutD family protein [Glutamicibacter arilaitensis]|uniref:HutD family protein n=1 Tax=Glutamicibacter arilaitensis TaxID=256701 RepID=UPI00384FD9F8